MRFPSQCLQPLGFMGDEGGTVSPGGHGACLLQMKGPAWARRVLPGSLVWRAAPAVGWERGGRVPSPLRAWLGTAVPGSPDTVLTP